MIISVLLFFFGVSFVIGIVVFFLGIGVWCYREWKMYFCCEFGRKCGVRFMDKWILIFVISFGFFLICWC